jgi:hypothetical protein
MSKNDCTLEVLELFSQDRSQSQIDKILQVGLCTVNRDLHKNVVDSGEALQII